jgi:hypothetical protein
MGPFNEGIWESETGFDPGCEDTGTTRKIMQTRRNRGIFIYRSGVMRGTGRPLPLGRG